MSGPTEDPDKLVGAMLNNKYQVQKRLSQGGMGVVYKARHVVLDTSVALKVLLQNEDNLAQERFLSEARLASKVRHPNTVYIADFGVLPDGRAFLEMEFIDGRTLSAELQKGAIDVLRACHIAMQIARGLQAVHEKGIIHRDMKPDNVFLIEQDGTQDFVKIVDFGIAKTARAETPKAGHMALSRSPDDAAQKSPLEAAAAMEGGGKPGAYTLPGNVMGTPGFMSPEQIQGLKLDTRVDQYALGCMLYEMIAGEQVLVGESLTAVMMKHLTTKPVPLRQRSPKAGVSESLDALVMRLLSKDPKERFASMREVELSLQSIIDRLQVARGQKPASAMWKTPQKLLQIRVLGRRVPLWAWAPLFVVCLGGLGYGAWRVLRGERGGPAEFTANDLLALQQRALAVVREDAQGLQAELRASAISALGQTHDAEQRPKLQEALASKDLETRTQAATALGALGDRQAAPALAALLDQGGNPPAVKIAAAGALRQLGDARGGRFLEQLLTASDADTAFRAALLFCEQGPPDAQRVLRATVQRPDLPEAVLMPALSCLARFGDNVALERLRSQMADVGPRELRLHAAAKLTQAGDAGGQKYLRDLAKKPGREQIIAARELALLDDPEGIELFRKVAPLRSAQSLVRQLAADGLGAVGEAIDGRLLAPLLDEYADPALRQAGARAILEIAGRDPGLLSAQSVSWARTALSSNDALLRQTAAAILGDTPGDNAVGLLVGVLGDRDPRTRRIALRSLERRENQAALRSFPPLREALQGLLDKGTAQDRVLAASLLLRQGDDSQLKRLRDYLTAPDAELRRAALEQLALTVNELLPLLRDTALAVRFVAARKLVEQKDLRGAAVLREAVAAGGPDAITAYGLLRRLGIGQDVPDAALKLLTDADPTNRSAAVEALTVIPWAQAEPYLRRAARDREAEVRKIAAEVSAHFAAQQNGGEPLKLLRRLSEDGDAGVRTRASALLVRRATPQPKTATDDKAGKDTATKPKTEGKEGAKEGSDEGSETPPPPPPSGATGQLVVDAAQGVQFAIDKRPLQSATDKPIPLEVGPHTLNFLSGQRTVEITAGQTTRVSIPTSQVEQLAKSGLESFHSGDFKKAQKQMQKAVGLCSRERQHAVQCAQLTYELFYRLGQIHEQQKEWPQAMNEYQRNLALSMQVRGRNDIKSDAQEAVQRLQPRLGQVVVMRPGKRGCQEEPMWLPPGTHSIKIDKKFETVEVTAKGVVRVGACK